jgi:hypothetical protein
MDITLRKCSKIVALKEQTTMIVRYIAKAVGADKLSVSRIIQAKHKTS